MVIIIIIVVVVIVVFLAHPQQGGERMGKKVIPLPRSSTKKSASPLLLRPARASERASVQKGENGKTNLSEFSLRRGTY